MFSYSALLPAAALFSLVQGHAQLLGAFGLAGSPSSVGFQVDANIARNCTAISPCQQDATIIRDAEIAANTVTECGRTEISGNIDVGANTESAIAAGQVTQVKAGSKLTVTIHQVNADGAGPYVCDMDEGSNSGVISQNLSVTNNVPGANGLSQAKAQDFNITVTMPDNLACTGGSTGNICTVRCRNNAVAGPFGGCLAVQQVGTASKASTPQNSAPAASAAAASTAAGTGSRGSGRNKGNANAGNNAVNGGGKNRNSNNKRGFASGLRWAKRYVAVGEDFSNEESS